MKIIICNKQLAINQRYLQLCLLKLFWFGFLFQFIFASGWRLAGWFCLVIFLPASPHGLCTLSFGIWYFCSLSAYISSFSEEDPWVCLDQEERKSHQALQQEFLCSVYLYPNRKEEWAVAETVGSSLGPSSVLSWRSSEEF